MSKELSSIKFEDVSNRSIDRNHCKGYLIGKWSGMKQEVMLFVSLKVQAIHEGGYTIGRMLFLPTYSTGLIWSSKITSQFTNLQINGKGLEEAFPQV